MNHIFRLKIVSKRQVTLPQLLLNLLHLREGDELEVEIERERIVEVRPMKVVPTSLFPPRILEKLNTRAEPATGLPVHLEEAPATTAKPGAAIAVGDEKKKRVDSPVRA